MDNFVDLGMFLKVNEDDVSVRSFELWEFELWSRHNRNGIYYGGVEPQ